MDRCPLTGLPTTFSTAEDNPLLIRYSTPATGEVLIAKTSLTNIAMLTVEAKYVLAGLFRHKQIKQVNTEFLKDIYKQNIPYSFKERQRFLLKYLYENGGSKFSPQSLTSLRDSTICYSSPGEFKNIIHSFRVYKWVEIEQTVSTFTEEFYERLRFTEKGIEEVSEKDDNLLMHAAKISILTGDSSVDDKIAFAQKLFFEDGTFDAKRSACETIAHVLEPLRKRVSDVVDSDTDEFFQIVNRIKVRHNKDTTKDIKHVEVLEWIFINGINTLNTYYKIFQKISGS